MHRALGCVGTITEGAIRDLDEMTAAGFKAIARRLCVDAARFMDSNECLTMIAAAKDTAGLPDRRSALAPRQRRRLSAWLRNSGFSETASLVKFVPRHERHESCHKKERGSSLPTKPGVNPS